MASIILFSTVTLISVFASTGENAIWIDQFERKDPRWEWNYNSGTGYKFLNPDFEGLTTVECGIKDSSSSLSYSDCSLITFLPPIKVFTFETRLKISNNNGGRELGCGTKGFGFWDGVGEDFAWFISYSPESSGNFVGFRAQVRSKGGAIQSTKIEIDLTEWHTYRIEVKAAMITFYIDNLKYATFSNSLNNLKKCSLWIDNYKINSDLTREYLDSEVQEKMWIDWVKRIE